MSALHDQLNDLLNKSNASVLDLKDHISGFNSLMTQTIIDAPVEEKSKMQKLKNNCMKTIRLAQEGNIKDAKKILKQMQNEYKDN